MKLQNFYKLLAPRPVVLISTIDSNGNSDAAPYSFIMPVSQDPPLICFSSVSTRKTLKNVRETKEFVVNIPTEEILPNLWRCAQYSGNERNDKIFYANLNVEKSKKVNALRIKECVGWIECKLEFEKGFKDRSLVIGSVVECEGKEGVCPLHIGKNKFGICSRYLNI